MLRAFEASARHELAFFAEPLEQEPLEQETLEQESLERDREASALGRFSSRRAPKMV